MHNLQIGNFYYKAKYEQQKGGLKGAQSRYREIVERYPNFSFMDEVLFRLATTYQHEEEPDEAAKYYQQILRNHPNSEFAEKAREQLGIIGAPVPEPDPARKNAPPPVRPGIVGNLFQQVSGKADVTTDKNGVLISKDGKEGTDLIDEALKYNGQLPTNVTPRAPTQLTTPKPAPVNSTPPSGAPNVTPVTNTAPVSTPVKP
jgi:tetratricopeptide (TPR) repeat protein